jgi:hypothetical protein
MLLDFSDGQLDSCDARRSFDISYHEATANAINQPETEVQRKKSCQTSRLELLSRRHKQGGESEKLVIPICPSNNIDGK